MGYKVMDIERQIQEAWDREDEAIHRHLMNPPTTTKGIWQHLDEQGQWDHTLDLRWKVDPKSKRRKQLIALL